MKKILSISELVDNLEVEGLEDELFAQADAAYDEDQQTLEVKLDSFLRQVTPTMVGDAPPKPSWLPPSEVVHEKVRLEESLPMTKDIFQSWVRRMRHALSHHTPSATAHP